MSRFSLAFAVVLVGHWFSRAGSSAKLNVVMFRRADDFERYAGINVSAYYLHEVLFEPWSVLLVPTSLQRAPKLTYEIALSIAYQTRQEQPRWLFEGIPTYFETAYFDDEGRFVVGKPPPTIFALESKGPTPASALLADKARQPFHDEGTNGAIITSHY